MSSIRGAVTLTMFVLNLVLWATPVILVGLVKLFLPKGDARNRVILFLAWLGGRWVATNGLIMDLMLPVRWCIDPLPQLQPGGRYLIVANHQSAVDIPVIFRIFHERIPFIRFFLKRTLLFAPVLGAACWAVEFPFMHRYSAAYLERYPEKRGEDIVTTRRSCRRYLRIPVAILNFMEGTRFTRQKHEEQNSPYRYLLRPRAGGIAHALAVMGDQLNDVLDVTIAYDCPDPTLWKWVCGRIEQIRVVVREIDVPPEFRNETIVEPGPSRDRFKIWINELWAQKDEILASVRAEIHPELRKVS